MACLCLGERFLYLSSISAILTMGREYVSDYQLYGKDEVAVCKYIEEYREFYYCHIHLAGKQLILLQTR